MTKRKRTPGRRFFDGKTYTIHDRVTNKWAANRKANTVRKQGLLARITGSGSSWTVWVAQAK